MEDKPLSPKWFIQAMALLAVAGMTIPLVAGVAGFIKDEIMRPAAIGVDGKRINPFCFPCSYLLRCSYLQQHNKRLGLKIQRPKEQEH